MRRSTASLEHLVVSFQGSHTKVGNLNVALTIKQQIFGLQIPMADVESMTVVNTGDTKTQSQLQSRVKGRKRTFVENSVELRLREGDHG